MDGDPDERSLLLLQQQGRHFINHSDQISTPTKDLIVRYDPDGDTECPRDWPQAYKWFIVFLLAFMAFTV